MFVEGIKKWLSFDANFSSFSLAKSPQRGLQIMFCSQVLKWNHTFLLHSTALPWKWQNDRYSLINKLGDQMIKQHYWTQLSQNISGSFVNVSPWIINISLSLQLLQITDLLATDKSRYFAQPRLIIVIIVLMLLVTFQWIILSIMLLVVRTLNMSGPWSVFCHCHISSVTIWGLA